MIKFGNLCPLIISNFANFAKNVLFDRDIGQFHLASEGLGRLLYEHPTNLDEVNSPYKTNGSFQFTDTIYSGNRIIYLQKIYF